jgi:hypothetical protein
VRFRFNVIGKITITAQSLLFVVVQSKAGVEYDLGKSALKRSNHEEAAAHFTQALKLDPSFAKAQQYLDLIRSHQVSR